MLPTVGTNTTSGPLVPPGGRVRARKSRPAGVPAQAGASLIAPLEVADGNEPGDEGDDHGDQQTEFGRADRLLVAQQEEDPPDDSHQAAVLRRRGDQGVPGLVEIARGKQVSATRALRHLSVGP